MIHVWPVMHVFLVFDKAFAAYPILGIYSTLEKARASCAAEQDVSNLGIYEEALDEEGETLEPIFHEVRI